MLKYKYIYIRIHNMYISNESQTFLIQAPAEQSKSLHFSNFGTSQRIIHQIPKPPQKNREKSWKHLTKIVRHHFSMCFFLVVLPIIVMVDFPQIEWRYDCLRTFRDRCLGRRKRIRRSKKKIRGRETKWPCFSQVPCVFCWFLQVNWSILRFFIFPDFPNVGFAREMTKILFSKFKKPGVCWFSAERNNGKNWKFRKLLPLK